MRSERTGSIQFWPVKQDARASGDDGGCGESVAGHVEKGAVQVDVSADAPQQGGDDAVHQHAGGGHDDHEFGLDGDGGREAMDGLNGDPERDDDKSACVDKGGQHAGALIAEGLGVAGRAGLEIDGEKAEQEGEEIGEVVAGLREQRQRVGIQSGYKGDGDVSQRGHQRKTQVRIGFVERRVSRATRADA